ncbi:MAG: redoxin domain-containing protein [Desulfobacterales bacterium]|nr:redoxin domain-containing protein [Desulfobacterales bacterium]
MLSIRTLVIITVVFALVLLSNVCVQSDSKNLVVTMDPAGFDKLMKTEDSRYIVVVMAAWCGPCRKELPALIRLNNRYKSQGLKMVGMGLDLEGPSVLQPVIDRLDVNFPVYWLGEKAIEKYKIYKMPALFFFRNGVIIETIIGVQSEKFLDKKIRDFLK